MAFNTVYDVPSEMKGQYAYDAGKAGADRENLARSQQMQLQAQLANQRYGQQNQQFAAEQQFRQQQLQQANYDKHLQGYQSARQDYDSVVADGMKNGWLKLNPEQKNQLRGLDAADQQTMLRDDLDDVTKIRMLHATMAQRRNVIPQVVPEWDRPAKIHEQAGEKVWILGRDGVPRQPVPGEHYGEGEIPVFMGMRNGVETPIPLLPKDSGKSKGQSSSSSGLPKVWAPNLEPHQKWAMAREDRLLEWKAEGSAMLDAYNAAQAAAKPAGLEMAPPKKPSLPGWELSRGQNGVQAVKPRMFDINDATEAARYVQFAKLIQENPSIMLSPQMIQSRIQERDMELLAPELVGGQSHQEAGTVPTVRSDADYDQLPSGTHFVAPDGTTRYKP